MKVLENDVKINLGFHIEVDKEILAPQRNKQVLKNV